MAKGYWELEAPAVTRLGNNEFRYYKNARKLQVFPVVLNSAYGIGKGATIDLAAMSEKELDKMFSFFEMAIGNSATLAAGLEV